MTAAISTADGIVAALYDHGIRTVFGLPGVQLDEFTDAVARHGRMRFLHTRHEQGAAYMALGAALASGEPAAYAVVPGPGILNSAGALCTAYACNAPVLAFTGQIPQALIGRGLGILHELPDQLAVLQLLTKWAGRIRAPFEAYAKVGEAFAQMTSGRRRPVALECAIDVLPQRAQIPFQTVPSTPTVPIDDDAVERAAKLLGAAKRPMIVVGGGALGAGAEVLAVAEMLQAPVISHRMGRGVVSERNPLSASIDVGYELWEDVDVVLGVGTRLQIQLNDWRSDAGIKIVRIDIDPEEIGRFAAPAVGILGDAADALTRLAARLGTYNSARPSRLEEMRERRSRSLHKLRAEMQPQFDFLDAIRAELPDDGIFVDDVTQLGHVARLHFPTYQPRTYLSPAYQGTLGWGPATALGAKAAFPDRAVVSISGDGGFLFTVQELATAVQHDIRVVFVVVNDNAYGNVRRTQTDKYNDRFIATDLVNPDFVKLAESFGMEGRRVHSPAELGEHLRAGFRADGPVLIEVPVGVLPDPLPFLRPPPVVRRV
jgi:acetolactate synthase I/II/III large subunit